VAQNCHLAFYNYRGHCDMEHRRASAQIIWSQSFGCSHLSVEVHCIVVPLLENAQVAAVHSIAVGAISGEWRIVDLAAVDDATSVPVFAGSALIGHARSRGSALALGL